jgi:amino acid transporter
MTVNLFGKLAFNGLTGLEQVAIFAGETHQPERTILRSAWIATPTVALMYILITGSMLAFTPAARIDLAAPVPQALAAAFASAHGTAASGFAFMCGRGAILALALAQIAQNTVIIAETSRLPLVAAWDHLLPPWFTRLHPRFKTPTSSLFVIVGLALGLGLFASLRAGTQEAFQVIATSANVFYGVNYLLMFAVPLAVGSRFGRSPSLLLRLGCLCGALVTCLSMALSLVPIVDVQDEVTFALKVGSSFVILNLAGILLYWRGRRRVAARALRS